MGTMGRTASTRSFPNQPLYLVKHLAQVWPVWSDMVDAFPTGMEPVLVVGSPVAREWVGIVIPEDILPLLVACVVRISDRPGLGPLTHSPDFEILRHVEHNIPMTKDIPGNLASFRGYRGDLQIVVDYEGVIIQHAQDDVEIVA